MKRRLEHLVACIHFCAFVEEILNQLRVTLFDSVVESSFIVSRVSLTQYLLLVAFPLAEELNHSARVSSLAKVKEGANFADALRGGCRLGLPLEVEVTLLEALDDFKLVAHHPVLLGVLLEVEREIWADHGAGEFFCRERRETLAHELEDDLLVCVICGSYRLPRRYWLVLDLNFFLLPICLCFAV